MPNHNNRALTKKMKVALVHYWLVTMRGGEKVLEELCRLYPEADIFTHVVVPEKVSDTIKAHKITTSFISRLPGAAKHYQKYLPLMPLALEQFDLRGYDLVISSESGPAKGVITGENTLHLCYCHTPMRYLWNMYQDYREGAGGFTRAAMTPAFHYLRQWDYASAARVDHFLANSTTVQRRIAKTYRRASDVIHPPVAVEDFSPADAVEDFYLYCGHLVPYKRADIAVEAFNRQGGKLVIVGEGGEAERLKKMAGPNIRFAGALPDEALRRLYATCRALVFPGEEDFGIVPVEAMASGRPVIAYGKGGVCDSVRDGSSGILYPEQSVDGLVAALARFEREESRFVPAAIAAEAARFSASRFREEIAAVVARKMADFQANGPFLA
jgi:glycosyltransferase involved in cell wall biosynthesis